MKPNFCDPPQWKNGEGNSELDYPAEFLFIGIDDGLALRIRSVAQHVDDGLQRNMKVEKKQIRLDNLRHTNRKST